MPALLAAMVVFLCSAAVLVLEILAGRLLAPYVGVTLETYTAVIGTILAGIAAGAWLGGALADRVDPRRILGPLIVAGGAFGIATVPIVRALGDASDRAGSDTIALSFAGFFMPALLLSAVTPTVVKLRLRDLEHTGRTVGYLSAVSTVGALVGTFVTGFLLVATAPTRGVIYGVGGSLVALGLVLWVWLSRRDRVVLVILAVATAGFAIAAADSSEPCQVESPYFCIRVEHDVALPSGRILWLDNLMHSYEDLDDPSYLAFEYTRWFADTIDARFPERQAIDALHVGGGGFTMPRYLLATRPGSRNVVLEVDQAVVDTARDELGLRTSASLRVRVGDARVESRALGDDAVHLVVGDAFGSDSVPWHLTTREYVAELDRVLRPDGIYVMNVIDDPPFRFARAELATLQERFAWVGLVATDAAISGAFGGNLVLVASHEPLDTSALTEAVQRDGGTLATGRALDRFVGNARVLTDDYAPVDQWLARERAD